MLLVKGHKLTMVSVTTLDLIAPSHAPSPAKLTVAQRRFDARTGAVGLFVPRSQVHLPFWLGRVSPPRDPTANHSSRLEDDEA
jgi:hypothetical protein